MTKAEKLVGALRDAFLIEADYLAERADWIELLLKQPTSQAVLKKRLSVGAGELRARVKMLHAVLEATQEEKTS